MGCNKKRRELLGYNKVTFSMRPGIFHILSSVMDAHHQRQGVRLPGLPYVCVVDTVSRGESPDTANLGRFPSWHGGQREREENTFVRHSPELSYRSCPAHHHSCSLVLPARDRNEPGDNYWKMPCCLLYLSLFTLPNPCFSVPPFLSTPTSR